jgi:hypothetical protein
MRRLIPKILLAMLLIFVLSTVLSNRAMAQVKTADLGASVSGVITSNTTWTLAGSPYIVSGDVFVIVDVFLTIQPGVTVSFVQGTGMTVDGMMVAQGDSGSMITFKSTSPTPTSGDWTGIKIRTGGTYKDVNRVTVEYSQYGIEGLHNSSVSQCVFTDNGVGVSGSNVNITLCTFERNNNGVNVTNALIDSSEFHNNVNAVIGNGTIENTIVSYNSGNGINFLGPITNCTINNNGGYGASAGLVSNCTIYNNNGDGVSANSITDCLVYGNNGTGISGSGSVVDCIVHSNGAGGVSAGSVTDCSVYSNTGNGVSANQIVNVEAFNNSGVGAVLNGARALNGASALMSNCTFYDNSAGGVVVNSGNFSDNSWATVEHSDIYDNLLGVLLSYTDTYCSSLVVKMSSCNISQNLQGGILTDELSYGPFCWEISLQVADTIIENNGRFGIRMNTTNIHHEEKQVYFTISEISDCVISNHVVGAIGNFGNITNSVISNNSIGVFGGSFDLIADSEIANNSIGAIGTFGNVSGSAIVHNSQTGLDVFGVGTGVNWNNIYDNGNCNVRNHVSFGQDINATCNWWGTANKTLIEASIYDYYEDFNLSRVLIEPFLANPNQIVQEFPSFFALPLIIIPTLLITSTQKKGTRAKKAGCYR